MKHKRKLGRKLLSFLLTLAMVVGLMPGMSLTAYADANYEAIDITEKVQSATSTSELVQEMNGFSEIFLQTAMTWKPPVTSGYVRLIYKIDGDYFRYCIYNNGTYSNNSNQQLSGLKKANNVKYYYLRQSTIAVTGVTIDPTATTLTVGGTETLTATVTPNDATDKSVTWTSDNNAVATVADGVVTAVAPGTASITVTTTDGNFSTSCAVTVNKANPTAPTGLTATYGQTLADVTLPTGWTWVNSTQSVGSVGSNTFKANFAGNDNYNAASDMDVTVTVSKATNPATVTSTATVMKGGNTVDLASNVTLNGATGEVTYAFNGDANGCTLSSSILTSGDNTGSVTVNISVAADDNYNALAATPITVTVSDKGTQTITASDVTATYGETGKKVEATTDGNGAISYVVKDGSADYIDVDTTTGALTIKKVGTATVIVTANETSTYAQATKDVTVTINKANAVATTVTANNRTYDGTDKPLVNVTGEPTGGTMQYALGTATEATQPYTTSIPTKTDAGTYYVWYKAVGDADHNDSEPGCATVTISVPEVVATPSFTPVEGTYTEEQSVTISCSTDGAAIHYTTDGSDPTASSTTYSSAISVGETTTIKAIAVKDGMTDSSVASATYTISEKPEPGTVAIPTFSPEGGTYSDPQMVSINSETSGATIYYTTDGNDPTTESATFSSEITVTETTTIKAIAVKEGMTDSSVASVTYTISEEPEPGPEPEPSEDTKVDVGGLSDGDITDDLRGKGYDSVESIESALQTALSIETEEKKENSELVDAKLMISTDGGETWQEATLENFPEGGIDAILPYPDGTNGNEYSFSVAHMIGAGDRAGKIETPSTTNTASGISAHFNGLSPVMITWTKNSSPSKDESKSEEKAHTHHYVWETVEATENSDGELRYKCDICGDIQTRVPVTAYYVFNKNTSEKIRKAGQGATVKIETSRWISFHKMVMQALVDRPDVSLEVSFLDGDYKGNRVSFIVPAGTDALSLLDENGFSGFLFLAGKFGTVN